MFEVSTAHTDGVDPLGAELGAGRLTAELEFSLLAVVGTLSTGRRALVSGGTGYTYALKSQRRGQRCDEKTRNKEKERDQ